MESDRRAPERPIPLTLTVPKAADYLGIGRDLMYELVRTRQIQSFRIKRRTLVPRAACEEWLDRQMDQAVVSDSQPARGGVR